MRKIGIGIPHDIKVINDGSKDEGPISLKVSPEGADYSVSLIRGGEGLESAGDSVTISSAAEGNVGSYPFEIGQGEASSLSHFFEPFRFKYSLEGEPELYEYLGKNNDNVISFNKLILPRDFSRYKGLKPFSFNGDLYLLGQTHRVEDSNFGIVALMVLDRMSNEFKNVKLFSEEPIDTIEFPLSVSGSPDYFTHDSKLHVAYRTYDRRTGADHIVVFRWEDSEDANSWRIVNKVKIPALNYTEGELEREAELDKFRLRAASSGDSVMIATFGVYQVANLNAGEGEGSPFRISRAPLISVRDARSLVSFDGFETYSTVQKDVAGVNVSASSMELNDGTYSNLFKFFDISYYKDNEFLTLEEIERERAYFEATSTQESVNFDLYFDRIMGSYVIFKQADKEGEEWGVWKHPRTEGEEYTAAQHLIAIKTTDSTYQKWDRLLVMPLDNRGVPDRGKNFAAHKLLDISVVPGEYKSKLIVSTTFEADSEVNINNNVYNNAVYQTDFAFLPNSLIKRRTYGEEVAVRYGGKSHPDWVFYYDGLTSDNSVLSMGSSFQRSSVPEYLADQTRYASISACSHLSQVFLLPEADGLPGRVTGYYGLAGEWSNIGEYQGYDYNLPSDAASLQSFGWDINGHAGASFEWSGDVGLNRFTVTNPDLTKFAEARPEWWNPFSEYVQSLRTNRRIDYFLWKLRANKYFKIKFDVEIESFAAMTSGRRVNVLTLGRSSPHQSKFSVQVSSVSGSTCTVDIYNNSGALVSTGEEFIDISRPFSLLISSCKSYNDMDDSLVVWARYSDESDWFMLSHCLYEYVEDISISNEFKIGVVATSFSPSDFTLSIGNLHIATSILSPHGEGVDSISYYFDSLEDRLPHVTGGFSSKIRECEVVGNEVELNNGVLIRLDQQKYGVEFMEDGRYIEDPINEFLGTYELARNKGRNSLDNVTNNFANFGFDFTNAVSDGEFEILFENRGGNLFNSLSLINFCGFQDFQLVTGVLNESSGQLEASEVIYYSVPFIELQAVAQDGYYMTVAGEFPDGYLKGYCAYVFDEVSGEYSEQLLVNNNFNDLIQFDQPLPTLTGKMVRLFSNAASFSVPDEVEATVQKHIAIRLQCKGDLRLAYIGEVSFNTFEDISELVSSYAESFSDSGEVRESMKGLLFPSAGIVEQIREELTLSLHNIPYNNEFLEVFKRLKLLGEQGINFPIVIRNDQGVVTTFGGIASGFRTSPEFYRSTIDLDLSLQNWEVESAIDVFKYPPVIKVTASTNSPELGDEVVFSANVLEYQGDTFTVVWAFSDGTEQEGEEVSFTFNNLGSEIVRARVITSGGLFSENFIIIYPSPLGIEYYTVQFSGEPYVGKPYIATFEARDKNDNIVASENAMRLTIEDISPGQRSLFDENGDGIPSETPSDRSGRLYQGILDIPIHGQEESLRSFLVKDSFGNVVLEFDIGFEVLFESDLIISSALDVSMARATTLNAILSSRITIDPVAAAFKSLETVKSSEATLDVLISRVASVGSNVGAESSIWSAVNSLLSTESELIIDSSVWSAVNSLLSTESDLIIDSYLDAELDRRIGMGVLLTAHVETDLEIEREIGVVSDIGISSEVLTDVSRGASIVSGIDTSCEIVIETSISASISSTLGAEISVSAELSLAEPQEDQEEFFYLMTEGGEFLTTEDDERLVSSGDRSQEDQEEFFYLKTQDGEFLMTEGGEYLTSTGNKPANSYVDFIKSELGSDLIFLYVQDELSGMSIMRDYSDNGLHGTYHGNLTLESSPVVAELPSTSAEYDGVSAYGRTPKGPEIDKLHQQPCTIFGWIDPDFSGGTATFILSDVFGSLPGAGVGVAYDNRANLNRSRCLLLLVLTDSFMSSPDYAMYNGLTANDIIPEEPHFLTVRYNGTDAAEVWINGEQVGEVERATGGGAASNFSTSSPATSDLGIGSNGENWGLGMDGKMQFIGAVSRYLSDAEIIALYEEIIGA